MTEIEIFDLFDRSNPMWIGRGFCHTDKGKCGYAERTIHVPIVVAIRSGASSSVLRQKGE